MRDRAVLAARHPASWLCLTAALTVAGGVAYVLKLKGYFIMPDELTYERDALHIAHTGRPVFSSDPYYTSLSQLAPLILAPVWLVIGPTSKALDASHIVNVAVFASACVPVFLLTRRITGSLPASLLAGAATVAVPWLAMSGTLMTEPVAYTAFCCGVLGMQRAVSEPGPRGDVLGLVAVALAVAARSQLVFLGPALVAALLVREAAAARSDGVVAVVRRHAVLLAAIVVGVAYVLVTGTSLRDTIGYYDITTQGDILPAGTFAYGRELLTSAGLACAGVTLPLAAGWALGALARPSRAQAFAGALVVLLAGAGLVLVAGAFSVRFTSGQNDRYISYLAPLLFTGTAAAFTVGPFNLATMAAAGVASVWVYWTSTLALFGPSLTSPASAFRTVIDGRSRQITSKLGIANADPTAVAAIVVAAVLVSVAIALSRLPRALVAGVVAAGVLAYGVAETTYTLHKVAQTQVGASPVFVASRGWADRAHPDDQPLNAFVGLTGDPLTTLGTWWDAVFYNREVDRVYEPAGTPPYEQPSYITVTVDPHTGAVQGLPGGYLIVATQPVNVGLRDARRVASYGVVSLVRVPAQPRATFSLETEAGTGQVPANSAGTVRVFGDGGAGRKRLTMTLVARNGPLRLSILGPGERRLEHRSLAKDAPVTVAVAVTAPGTGPATVRVRADAPGHGAAKDAYVQALAIDAR